MSKRPSPRVLKTALDRLLAEPGGKGGNADSFRGAVWVFLEAFCQIPGGQALLEENGDFLRRHTTPGTKYAEAWKPAKRHATSGIPWRFCEQSGPEKACVFDLASERDTIRRVVGMPDLPGEAAKDLSELMSNARSLAAKAIIREADGCNWLLQMHLHKEKTYVTRMAPECPDKIKAAAEHLVDELQRTKPEAVGNEPETPKRIDAGGEDKEAGASGKQATGKSEGDAADGQTSIPLTGEERALALLVKHPEWTNTKIAKAVPCARTTLYKWKRYVGAREALESGRHDLPRGSKDAETGHLEAWDDKNDK